MQALTPSAGVTGDDFSTAEMWYSAATSVQLIAAPVAARGL
jgi:hypothetical protein